MKINLAAKFAIIYVAVSLLYFYSDAQTSYVTDEMLIFGLPWLFPWGFILGIFLDGFVNIDESFTKVLISLVNLVTWYLIGFLISKIMSLKRKENPDYNFKQ